MPPLFYILWRSKLLWVIYIVMPLLLGGIIYMTFIQSVPRGLSIGIVDEDNSTFSKDLIFEIRSSPTFKVEKNYASIHAAKNDLASGKIYGLVVLPYGLQRHLKSGLEQKIAFYYNTQFILIGKALDNALLQIITTQNVKLEAGRDLIKSQNIKLALSHSLPISFKINAFFNPKNSYAQFLVTLILPCLWQILLALGLLNLISFKIKNTIDFFVRIGFNLFVMIFWAMVMVFMFWSWGFVVLGDLNLVFFGFLMLGLAISGVVLLLQSILQDTLKSLSLVAAYTAPSLAFAGVTYPQGAMENFGLFWSQILPISHFMKLYFQQTNYDGSILDGLQIIAPMSIFLLLIPLAFLIYRLKGKI